MTLINARRRFEALGWEVERVPVGAFKFKARPIGTLKWTQADCLVALLTAAGHVERIP